VRCINCYRNLVHDARQLHDVGIAVIGDVLKDNF
jgi:hypothetical protein